MNNIENINTININETNINIEDIPTLDLYEINAIITTLFQGGITKNKIKIILNNEKINKEDRILLKKQILNKILTYNNETIKKLDKNISKDNINIELFNKEGKTIILSYFTILGIKSEELNTENIQEYKQMLPDIYQNGYTITSSKIGEKKDPNIITKKYKSQTITNYQKTISKNIQKILKEKKNIEIIQNLEINVEKNIKNLNELSIFFDIFDSYLQAYILENTKLNSIVFINIENEKININEYYENYLKLKSGFKENQLILSLLDTKTFQNIIQTYIEKMIPENISYGANSNNLYDENGKPLINITKQYILLSKLKFDLKQGKYTDAYNDLRTNTGPQTKNKISSNIIENNLIDKISNNQELKKDPAINLVFNYTNGLKKDYESGINVIEKIKNNLINGGQGSDPLRNPNGSTKYLPYIYRGGNISEVEINNNSESNFRQNIRNKFINILKEIFSKDLITEDDIKNINKNKYINAINNNQSLSDKEKKELLNLINGNSLSLALQLKTTGIYETLISAINKSIKQYDKIEKILISEEAKKNRKKYAINFILIKNLNQKQSGKITENSLNIIGEITDDYTQTNNIDNNQLKKLGFNDGEITKIKTETTEFEKNILQQTKNKYAYNILSRNIISYTLNQKADFVTNIDNKNINLYSDIEGIGKGDLSDITEDKIIQYGNTIAKEIIIMAISGGIANITSKALIRASTTLIDAATGLKLAKTISNFYKLSKIYSYETALIGIMDLSIEGSLFHVFSSILEGNISGLKDTKGYLKSIAFIGIMRGFSKMVSGSKAELKGIDINKNITYKLNNKIITKNIASMTDDELFYFLNNPDNLQLLKKITITPETSSKMIKSFFTSTLPTIGGETISMFGTGVIIDIAFEGKTEISLESLMNTLTIVIGLKIAHKGLPTNKLVKKINQYFDKKIIEFDKKNNKIIFLDIPNQQNINKIDDNNDNNDNNGNNNIIENINNETPIFKNPNIIEYKNGELSIMMEISNNKKMETLINEIKGLNLIRANETKIINIITELVQNGLKYRDKQTDPVSLNAITVDGYVYITVENTIPKTFTTQGGITKNTRKNIEEKINTINNLSANEIKQEYRNKLGNQQNKDDIHEKTGAGIGLLEIARKIINSGTKGEIILNPSPEGIISITVSIKLKENSETNNTKNNIENITNMTNIIDVTKFINDYKSYIEKRDNDTKVQVLHEYIKQQQENNKPNLENILFSMLTDITGISRGETNSQLYDKFYNKIIETLNIPEKKEKIIYRDMFLIGEKTLINPISNININKIDEKRISIKFTDIFQKTIVYIYKRNQSYGTLRCIAKPQEQRYTIKQEQIDEITDNFNNTHELNFIDVSLLNESDIEIFISNFSEKTYTQILQTKDRLLINNNNNKIKIHISLVQKYLDKVIFGKTQAKKLEIRNNIIKNETELIIYTNTSQRQNEITKPNTKEELIVDDFEKNIKNLEQFDIFKDFQKLKDPSNRNQTLNPDNPKIKIKLLTPNINSKNEVKGGKIQIQIYDDNHQSIGYLNANIYIKSNTIKFSGLKNNKRTQYKNVGQTLISCYLTIVKQFQSSTGEMNIFETETQRKIDVSYILQQNGFQATNKITSNKFDIFGKNGRFFYYTNSQQKPRGSTRNLYEKLDRLPNKDQNFTYKGSVYLGVSTKYEYVGKTINEQKTIAINFCKRQINEKQNKYIYDKNHIENIIKNIKNINDTQYQSIIKNNLSIIEIVKNSLLKKSNRKKTINKSFNYNNERIFNDEQLEILRQIHIGKSNGLFNNSYNDLKSKINTYNTLIIEPEKDINKQKLLRNSLKSLLQRGFLDSYNENTFNENIYNKILKQNFFNEMISKKGIDYVKENKDILNIIFDFNGIIPKPMVIIKTGQYKEYFDIIDPTTTNLTTNEIIKENGFVNANKKNIALLKNTFGQFSYEEFKRILPLTVCADINPIFFKILIKDYSINKEQLPQITNLILYFENNDYTSFINKDYTFNDLINSKYNQEKTLVHKRLTDDLIVITPNDKLVVATDFGGNLKFENMNTSNSFYIGELKLKKHPILPHLGISGKIKTHQGKGIMSGLIKKFIEYNNRPKKTYYQVNLGTIGILIKNGFQIKSYYDLDGEFHTMDQNLIQQIEQSANKNNSKLFDQIKKENDIDVIGVSIK